MEFRVALLRVLIIGLWAIPTAQSQDQQQQEDFCPLECGQRGVCVLGEADFLDHPTESPEAGGGGDTLLSFHQETSRGGFHCECESGWTGLQCNVEFQSCLVDHKCYHGGDCVEGLVDKYGNDQHWCDCQHAVDADGTAHVGKYCEHPAANYCDEEGAFCIEGQCNPNYPNSNDQSSVNSLEDDIGVAGQPMCLCNQGHVGEHCQYVKGSVPKCSLDCQNGGHCVLGELPVDASTSISGAYHLGDAMRENRDDMQHCLCPDGYDGELCQRRKETCGEGQCLWGAQCIEKIGTDGSPHYHCDCATSEKDVAGQFCQYEKTTHCGISDFNNKNLFCTNGGTCKPNIYEGCDCNSGYSGFSCQYQTHEIIDSSTPSSGASSTTTLSSPSSASSQPAATSSSQSAAVETTAPNTSIQSTNNGDVTNICTNEEDWGPGKPLSFCVHGGQCKAQVSAEESHPGCSCGDSWAGPHCEIHVALESEEMATPTSTSTASTPATTTTTTSSSEGESTTIAKEGFLLSIGLVLLVAIVLSCLSVYLKRQKKQRAMVEGAQFGNNDDDSYRDEPNIAPHRDSNADPFPRRLYSSSSDPFASLGASSAMPESSDLTRSATRVPTSSPIVANRLPNDGGGGDGYMTPVEIC